MKLTIKTPRATQEYDTAWVEVNTSTGNMVIQPGHAPSIIVLSPYKPLIFKLTSGKEETIMVTRGVIEITRTELLALLSNIS